jgi:hypothetical protein
VNERSLSTALRRVCGWLYLEMKIPMGIALKALSELLSLASDVISALKFTLYHRSVRCGQDALAVIFAVLELSHITLTAWQ